MPWDKDALVPLARRAAMGDRIALEALLRALYPSVLGYQERWTNRCREAWTTADDLAQDTLLRIADAIAGCRADTSQELLSWVLTIARHVAIDHLRTRRRDPVHGAQTLAEVAVPVIKDAECIVEGALRDFVRAAYDSAPESLQRLLWLRLVQGDTWQRIAIELGTSFRAAQRRYQRFQAAVRSAAVRTGIEPTTPAQP